MKLTIFKAKNFIVLLSLTIFLCSNSICIQNDRTKTNLSKFNAWKLSKDNELTPSPMSYLADLIIENKAHNTIEELPVYIEQKSTEISTYGFEVILKDPKTAIKSPIFFLTRENTYFLSLRPLTSNIDCINDGLFSNSGMVFVFSLNNETIIVSFKYHNSWAFNDKFSVNSVCLNISNNYGKFIQETQNQKKIIIETLESVKNLKEEREKSIATEKELKKYIEDMTKVVKASRDQRETTISENKNIDQKMRNFENKKNAFKTEYEKLNTETRTIEEQISLKNQKISNYRNVSADIKKITPEDLNKLYKDVTINLEDFIKIHHESDEFIEKFKDLSLKPQNKFNKIKEALNVDLPDIKDLEEIYDKLNKF